MPKIKTFPLMGSKSQDDLDRLVDLYKYSDCTKFIDVFGGSLRCTIAVLLSSPESKAYVTELDTGLYCIYRAMLGDFNRSELEATYNEIKLPLLENPNCWWKHLQIEATQNNLGDELTCSVLRLIYQQNVIMSSARHNDRGELNCNIDVDKFSHFERRGYNLPDYYHLSDRCVITNSSYTDNVVLRDTEIKDSFVNVDPPYYLPGKTPCYQGHEPVSIYHSINSVYQYLHRSPRMLVAWNFDSKELDSSYRELATTHNYQISKVTLSPLVMAKAMKSSAKPNANHALWIFDRYEDRQS